MGQCEIGQGQAPQDRISPIPPPPFEQSQLQESMPKSQRLTLGTGTWNVAGNSVQFSITSAATTSSFSNI